MQAAKDSFYMALRDRLSALNPARTIVVDGETRPAIVVRENTETHFAVAQPEAFYLDWGSVKAVEETRPILEIECEVWYSSEGASQAGVDRGRTLAEMDDELVRICAPPHTAMRDYRQSPSVDLGASVSWTLPLLSGPPGAESIQKQWRSASDGLLERRAQLRVYFLLPEVRA
jgi:hypothetical protein